MRPRMRTSVAGKFIAESPLGQAQLHSREFSFTQDDRTSMQKLSFAIWVKILTLTDTLHTRALGIASKFMRANSRICTLSDLGGHVSASRASLQAFTGRQLRLCVDRLAMRRAMDDGIFISLTQLTAASHKEHVVCAVRGKRPIPQRTCAAKGVAFCISVINTKTLSTLRD